MKTFLSLVTLTILAALVAFPLSFELGMSLVFVAGLSAIVAADYARPPRPFRIHAVPVSVARVERLRLAA